ncbi:helix-turn-helix domain-containing protein [Alteromonas gilva]|uniref:Helix-turn-helix domain-containing protein n=1 Tax=Alteromonas gilva TaxID=2987522 RepID=A0ABT5L2H6_9ALTE|nr:helix-turn-helix domain-containing protein [Alteromonas gilva]MDC8831245.1 helix-turn-helix domain-containing protein [Alteromonas gilva]
MNVTVLVCEQLSMFELACATELFALPRPEFNQWYRTKIVALKGDQFSGLCDTTFTCPVVNTLPATDLLVVPSFPVHITKVDTHIANEVLAHYRRGGRIISFCSGAFLLGALGILDNREAITHWRYASEFKQRFPAVSYCEDSLYVYDGQIGCSAGSAAAIDLGIEIIRQDFGYEYANAVARRLVLPAHRDGGQSQYIQKPLARPNNTLAKCIDWALTQLSPQLTVNQMAQKANMTRRTFDRHFIKQFNITAHQWLCERKLDVARQLLETTTLSIEQIALRAGFDNAITLRHNFRKYLSVSPTHYRQTFRKLPDTVMQSNTVIQKPGCAL